MHQGFKQDDGGHQHDPGHQGQVLVAFEVRTLILHVDIGKNYLQKMRGFKELKVFKVKCNCSLMS